MVTTSGMAKARIIVTGMATAGKVGLVVAWVSSGGATNNPRYMPDRDASFTMAVVRRTSVPVRRVEKRNETA